MEENTKIEALCRSCEGETNHQILQTEIHSGEFPFRHHSEDIYWWETKYQIIECLGCNLKAFRTENTNSEDHDFNEVFVNVGLYPEWELDNLKVKNYFAAPGVIQKIYNETIKAYNSNMEILCAAGARSLVEGICKTQKIKKGNITYIDDEGISQTKKSDSLSGQINALSEKGILSKKNAEALQEHKFLGNAALHELDIPSKKSLRLSIEILENILDSIYAIPIKVKYLQRERKSNIKSK
jgi:hypothetical protein